jgi:tRNA:m4X modification enzyme
VCSAKKEAERLAELEYFHRDFNAGAQGAALQAQAPRPQLDAEPPEGLVARVLAAADRLPQRVIDRSKLQLSAALRARIRGFRAEGRFRRHFEQQMSLCAQLAELGLLPEGADRNGARAPVERTCFLELGAGKGGVSSILAQIAAADLCVVDRRGFKSKYDKIARDSECAIERVTVDIMHLDAAKIPMVRRNARVVAHSKHLCGAATDFALRCIVNSFLCGEGAPRPSVAAVLIATCCHQCCEWRHYVNTAFFARMGFSEKDFAAIARLSSWRLSWNGAHGDDDGEDAPAPQQERECGDRGSSEGGVAEAECKGAAALSERERVGEACKRLLDLGRVEFLREHGLDAELIEFCSAAWTPENRAILAAPPRRPA